EELDSILGARWKQDRSRQDSGIPLSSILPSLAQVVILGGPGSGKSTLIRFLARRCADGELENSTPVVFSLASYAETRAARGLTIRAYVSQIVKERGGSVLEAALNDEWSTGRIMVFMDGVDEVPDAAQRRATIQAVEAFREQEPGVCMIVTSRPV